MQIVFLIRPYAISMYSFHNNTHTLLGDQKVSHIQDESHTDYESRMIFVCKDICQDFIRTDVFKNNHKDIKDIKVILTNPWSIYEIINLEKDFEKDQVIDMRTIDNMIVHKQHDDLSIIKNNIFNISLNGYSVQNINGQKARFLHLQYLSVFSSTLFLNKLKNTLETIFHLHNIQIDSVYSYVNELDRENKDKNELRIIIEDQSIDLMYVNNGRIISTLFIPCGCVNVKAKIKETLHIDDVVLNKILKSKSMNINKLEKSLDNIWPDLSPEVKNSIDTQISLNLEFMKIQIRNFVDSVDVENIVKDIKINIYTLDEDAYYTLGLILADNFKNDVYMMSKLLTIESNVFTKKIF